MQNWSKYLTVSMDGLNVSADPWFGHFRLAKVLTEFHGDAAAIVPKNKNLLKRLNTVRYIIFVMFSINFTLRFHWRWENYKIIGILLNLFFNIWWSLRTQQSVQTVDFKTSVNLSVNKNRHNSSKYMTVSVDGLNVSADPWFVHFRLEKELTELNHEFAANKINTVRIIWPKSG